MTQSDGIEIAYSSGGDNDKKKQQVEAAPQEQSDRTQIEQDRAEFAEMLQKRETGEGLSDITRAGKRKQVK